MEQPGARVVRPVNPTDAPDPNHLIIWLDQHIGQSGQCVLLKRQFFMTADPTTGYDGDLREIDIDNGIRSSEAIPVRLDRIQFTLRTFDNPTTCFEAIKHNLDKRIFFITSGRKGKIIVPQLVSNFPDKFDGKYAIYVFCAKMNMTDTEGAGESTNDWAMEYLDSVLMFDFQDSLLARLVLDIAKYFLEEAKKLEDKGELNNALEHFNWSKTMFIRREEVGKQPNLMKANIRQVDQRINDIERRLKDQQEE